MQRIKLLNQFFLKEIFKLKNLKMIPIFIIYFSLLYSKLKGPKDGDLLLITQGHVSSYEYLM
jgi:hypothetical protein